MEVLGASVHVAQQGVDCHLIDDIGKVEMVIQVGSPAAHAMT